MRLMVAQSHLISPGGLGYNHSLAQAARQHARMPVSSCRACEEPHCKAKVPPAAQFLHRASARALPSRASCFCRAHNRTRKAKTQKGTPRTACTEAQAYSMSAARRRSRPLPATSARLRCAAAAAAASASGASGRWLRLREAIAASAASASPCVGAQ